jgi:transmembrane sensor
MTEDNKLREILLKKLLDKELSESEKGEFESWLRDPVNKSFYETHLQKRELLEVVEQVLQLDESRLDQKMREALYPNQMRRPNRRPIVWLAAASVTLLAGGLFYWQFRSTANPNGMQAKAKEILPATNRARLKLSNGNILYLDSTRNGKIATQGNVDITKTAGELAYVAPIAARAEPSGINELTVPKAGQFQLRLPDGTHVWLNSATDISYPLSFGSERRVKINGEAFFDVAKDPEKPFIVETAHGVTKVLGTSFNVNAYAEDSVEMITLLTGSVSVTSTNKTLTLHTGEQAFERQDKLSLEHPNIQAITAWRRGFFYFQDADVHSIMRQFSRFYDVAVRYEGQPSRETYDGLISRDLTLSEALALLNKLNIKARLNDDKTIIVAPEILQK